jgi:UDP-sugar transporter A1/2/3
MSAITTPMLSLFSLVLQNTALAVLLKLTFREGARPYAESTAVLCTEFLKLCTCLIAVARRSASSIPLILLQIWSQKALFLPAMLYVVQSNLLFFASKNLSPVVYIVCTQLKTITSAGFSWLLLGTTLRGTQYISLFFLLLGIVLVHASDLDSDEVDNVSSTAGIFAAVLASLTSGLAGVILEKIYKDPTAPKGLQHTVWTRNVQLSIISIPFALSGVYVQAREKVFTGNFFEGYDYVVWSVILLQAIGGIITAFVLKFAGAVMKCIAVSLSICFCAAYSVWTDELAITAKLLFGIIIVIAAVLTFSTAQSKDRNLEYTLKKGSTPV